MQNLNFLAGAYIAVWVGFFAYLFFLNRRQNRLMEEMGELKERLESKLKV